MTLREGNLEAPTRHPVDWRSPDYGDEGKALAEMERVFDICHGCRRCVSLCQSFPTLFDLIDATADGEVHEVDKNDYAKVVEQCYLCDLCYMTKCPYVPPHPWNVDFPHLMLRAKAIRYGKGEVGAGAKLLASTAVLDHNAIPYEVVEKESCCGMPKLELGDLEGVARLKEKNVPVLARYAREGFAILTAIPSCTLMFKQELPLMFPDDADVKAVQDAMFDPFEYLVARHRDGLLKTDFTRPLGK